MWTNISSCKLLIFITARVAKRAKVIISQACVTSTPGGGGGKVGNTNGQPPPPLGPGQKLLPPPPPPGTRSDIYPSPPPQDQVRNFYPLPPGTRSDIYPPPPGPGQNIYPLLHPRTRSDIYPPPYDQVRTSTDFESATSLILTSCMNSIKGMQLILYSRVRVWVSHLSFAEGRPCLITMSEVGHIWQGNQRWLTFPPKN